MTSVVDSRLLQAYLVRVVEDSLLQLFAAGRLAGTTHTCIGQEMSAVALAEALDRERDYIFSNHRCHGHYLAWTDDVDGLIAEVMGRRTGVCAGLGGSQHLCGRRFYSNGVQGGTVPVAAGLAFAQKLSGTSGIVAVCIGDGTLGEGVIYETFNIAVKWGLPLLIVLENNLYAQSTSQSETLAGDICARAAAFGMATFSGDTWGYDALAGELRRAAALVREQCVPAFVRVDTYRLAAHSKGDDDREPAEIATFARRDPVNKLLAEPGSTDEPMLVAIRERVSRAIERADREPALEWQAPESAHFAGSTLQPVELGSGTQLEAINEALREWMSEDLSLVLIGEDIRSPYGGAFKVTRGLSDAYPHRVLNTPISEAAIVGIGNGLTLGGRRAVVEIMFGDFLALCFDQILNQAAKFRGMYNRKVTNPVVIRAPMGGGRGYGPTHSQNLEKHVVGIPGMAVIILHGRTRIDALYGAVRAMDSPVLIIENKLLYRERSDTPLPPGYAAHEYGGSPFRSTVLRTTREPDLTVVAFGRMSVIAERAASQLATEEEVLLELIFPLQVSPLDAAAIVESVSRTGKLIVIEEGASGFDLGSEIIATVAVECRDERRPRFARIAAQPTPIPNALELEKQALPSVTDIVDACLVLFDE